MKNYYVHYKTKMRIYQPAVPSVSLIKETLHRSSAEHNRGFINT